jgi:putative hydrolase of the HAD superfamily
VDLLTRVRDVAPVALVANGSTPWEQDLARQRLDSLAHTVVETARMFRVYPIVAERVGATAERCLFVDDTEASVTAARDAGVAALHYRGLDDHACRSRRCSTSSPCTAFCPLCWAARR